MTPKQQKVADLAQAKGLQIVFAPLTNTLLVRTETGSIGIQSHGKSHEVWFTPNSWGFTSNVPMKSVVEMLSR